MKKLVTAAMAIALAFSASAAQAQAEDLDLGIFFDAAGTQSTGSLAIGTGSLYVVGFGLDTVQLSAYELRVTGLGAGGAGLLLFPETLWPAGTALKGPGGPEDFVVATGGCVSGEPATVLVTINFFNQLVTPADTAICVGQAEQSSFESTPGFGRCDVSPAQLVPFGVAQNGENRYPDGCLIVNATQDGPVPTETSSFGEIKARF